MIDLVYRYRVLLDACAAGDGLTIDEIDELNQVEARFAAGADDLRAREGRRFRREPVTLSAVLRGGALHDAVTVSELAPGGLVCRRAPYAAVGTLLDVVVDDPVARRSYRFKGRVQWVGDDTGGDHRLGVALLGGAVMTRHAVPSVIDPSLAYLAA